MYKVQGSTCVCKYTVTWAGSSWCKWSVKIFMWLRTHRRVSFSSPFCCVDKLYFSLKLFSPVEPNHHLSNRFVYFPQVIVSLRHSVLCILQVGLRGLWHGLIVFCSLHSRHMSDAVRGNDRNVCKLLEKLHEMTTGVNDRYLWYYLEWFNDWFLSSLRRCTVCGKAVSDGDVENWWFHTVCLWRGNKGGVDFLINQTESFKVKHATYCTNY